MASAERSGFEVSDELKELRTKLDALKESTYENLTPMEQVQVARHPERPYTLDYIERIFTNWVELHGDRAFRDDEAIVGGWAALGGTPVMVIGHQKGRDMKENLRRNFGMAPSGGLPEGLEAHATGRENSGRRWSPSSTPLGPTPDSARRSVG